MLALVRYANVLQFICGIMYFCVAEIDPLAHHDQIYYEAFYHFYRNEVRLHVDENDAIRTASSLQI